jgi:hypothetical protein
VIHVFIIALVIETLQSAVSPKASNVTVFIEMEQGYVMIVLVLNVYQ